MTGDDISEIAHAVLPGRSRGGRGVRLGLAILVTARRLQSEPIVISDCLDAQQGHASVLSKQCWVRVAATWFLEKLLAESAGSNRVPDLFYRFEPACEVFGWAVRRGGVVAVVHVRPFADPGVQKKGHASPAVPGWPEIWKRRG